MTAYATATPSQRITAEVTSWPGVEAGPGSRGEFGFRVGRRQIGHLHGDRAAHFGFPRKVWSELLDEGRVTRHPIDQPGWAARAIEDDEDVADVIALLRLNYDRVIERYGLPDAPDADPQLAAADTAGTAAPDGR
jgi:hypothetical protein